MRDLVKHGRIGANGAAKLHPLHPNCVACQSREATAKAPFNAEQAALTLMGMLMGGHTLEATYRTLCLRHRRMVDDTADAVRKGTAQ